jgi:hypothetical protein
MTDFKLLDTKSKQYCCLREYFETLEGELKMNSIDPERIMEVKIVDLEKRPEFTPSIKVFKMKQLGEKRYQTFSENIYTYNAFLTYFKNFLRASAEEVEAEGFDKTPKKYVKGYYETPFALIPIDTREVGVVLRQPGELPKLLKHQEIFCGVDYSRKATLKLVKAETVDEKLKEIEKDANFSAAILNIDTSSIRNGRFENEKLEAIEVKTPGLHYAVTGI